MKWRGRRQSSQVEDRRSEGHSVRQGGSGGSLLPMLFMLLRSKVGRIVIVVGIVFLIFTGQNPLNVITGQGTQSSVPSVSPESQGEDDELAGFVRVVLADTEDYWGQIFSKSEGGYREPILVMFRGRTSTACGMGQAAVGPFYCPLDEKIYIDLSFYQQLRDELGAGGDFAQAYVIAHEVGHHVQHLLGISDKVQQQRQSVGKVEGNELSVRLELQADCLAGMWGSYAEAQGFLDVGDLEEAVNAAESIGDDTLQKQAGAPVRPDSFTHGTSAQRAKWFQQGLNATRFNQCDTFAAGNL